MEQNLIIVEGNIGVGKSTFLEVFENTSSSIRTTTEIVAEPLEKWKDVNGINAFELFYSNPSQHGFTFENIVYTTVVETHVKPLSSGMQTKLMERSLWSAHNVFGLSLFNNLHLNQLQWESLSLTFDLFCRSLVGYNPNQIIYLTCPPQVLQKRISERSRSGEGTISLNYLEQLDRLYQEWIWGEVAKGVQVTFINTDKSKNKMRNEFIRIIDNLQNQKI